ncbi:glycoside hydrolase family 43 protein [Streptococcus porci]|uniref:glycoside hydrolase family 43 protein n=1 Tax=Streptococcus porci TaxID=502567 RepID=UPI00040B26D6|nr:glycoside hydrolase family 43 protein [Streptococcus porci]
MASYRNPIIEGFSPDPSVCAVGDDYYLVTSTFAYFPGVAIYHSKDLVNWEHIGNVLDREEQLPLKGAEHSQGIFAPCIRYHNGVFYMITTNVTHGGNFYVTATDPKGPWSEPHYLDNAPGIDPSLFFDDDGRCYYVGTRPNPKGVTYNGDWEVWLQELDLSTHQLIGVSTFLWKGALRDVIWPEGPHVYKKDGYYYLMIAEGGTSFNHCVTIARSEQVGGPYIGNKNNPILTHRHLGKNYPVCNVGHGDLVETPDGRWYMTCLASRIFDGYSNLGRETFLAEVTWEDGWPVVNVGEGRLLVESEHYLKLVDVEEKTHFGMSSYSPEFMYLRNPDTNNYQWGVDGRKLRLIPSTMTLRDLASPTYVGTRQKSMYYRFSAQIESYLGIGSRASIVILQNNDYFVELTLEPNGKGYRSRLLITLAGEESCLGEVELPSNVNDLIFEGNGQALKAIVCSCGKEIIVAENIDVHYLSTEVAGGFVGCTIGIFTTSPSSDDCGYIDVIEVIHERLPSI